MHNSCICNEFRGLAERHLVYRGLHCDASLFTQTRARQFAQYLNISAFKMSHRSVVNSYVGAKRRTYERAYEHIKGPRYIRQWAAISSFVKPDKYPLGVIADKAPRMIQFRTPMYNLLLASYLKPYEHAYYAHVDFTGLQVVAKGLNNLQRAANIVEASLHFNAPIYVLCDHSKFDSHVQVPHLRFLHALYRACYPDSYLRLLLSYQINNRGYTKHGIKYRVKGTRMSGDYDTALGNTLLNHYMIHTVFGRVKHHALIDGDDSVIIIEARDLCLVNFDLFRVMGFNTVTQVVNELNDVEFCRSRLLTTEPPRFAREPRRALSNMSVSLKEYTGNDAWRRYLAGMGLGELAVSNGVPILGPIAAKLSSLHTKPIFDSDYGHKGVFDQLVPITDDVRLQFYHMYGITPEVQIIIESEYLTPDLVCGKLNVANETSYAAQESQ